MQGIGSDPTYRPGAGSGSGSGGIVAPEVAAQVAEVSQKALSFVSSVSSNAIISHIISTNHLFTTPSHYHYWVNMYLR